METNAERRRRKLTALCKQRGLDTIAENAQVSPDALDQVIKGTLLPVKKDGTRNMKGLGDENARAIEKGEGLPVGWFDSDAPLPGQSSEPAVAATGAPQPQTLGYYLAQKIDSLPDDPILRGQAFSAALSAINDVEQRLAGHKTPSHDLAESKDR